MEREVIALLAQLLTGIKDALIKLERAEKVRDTEEIAAAKREIMSFQSQISRLL
ncbi:hypothetical protein KW805_03135 [Candidatus Pacearchaeota archaeon]|nr:hypothetical protein [Candidatus Pacearchaeota archaeon]